MLQSSRAAVGCTQRRFNYITRGIIRRCGCLSEGHSTKWMFHFTLNEAHNKCAYWFCVAQHIIGFFFCLIWTNKHGKTSILGIYLLVCQQNWTLNSRRFFFYVSWHHPYEHQPENVPALCVPRYPEPRHLTSDATQIVPMMHRLCHSPSHDNVFDVCVPVRSILVAGNSSHFQPHTKHRRHVNRNRS